jgi:hypothetical protein
LIPAWWISRAQAKQGEQVTTITQPSVEMPRAAAFAMAFCSAW